jgi:hypothetical protein
MISLIHHESLLTLLYSEERSRHFFAVRIDELTFSCELVSSSERGQLADFVLI